VLPKESVVGRLAGDEFAVFVEATDDANEQHDQAGSLARLLPTSVAHSAARRGVTRSRSPSASHRDLPRDVGQRHPT